jgi:uncharacterized protein (DUF488 family)
MVSLWTVGHSTRAADAFVALLQAHQIELIVDVRRFPASRRHPHFNSASLAAVLDDAGIGYRHVEALGGRRTARRDSKNTAWRHESFRGYADYMETPAFATALQALIAEAERQRTAIMCAEAVWWQCHRQMISDALKARGVRVWHIVNLDAPKEHPYTSAARIIEGELRYGPSADSLEQFWEE